VKKITILSLCLLMALLFAAPYGYAEETPQYGGTLRLSMYSSPEGLWLPARGVSTYDVNIINMLYDSLLELDEFMEPTISRIAESWEFNDDKTKVTFKLREDVTFHDGSPLTARDVWYTYTQIGHPDYEGTRIAYNRYLLGFDEYRENEDGKTLDYEAYMRGEKEYLKGIQVINDYEISFESTEFSSRMLADRVLGIMPYHIWKDVPIGQLHQAQELRVPIGSGPFKFVSFARDQYVVLEAFEDYYLGRPYLDEVIWLIRNQEVALMELEKGGIHIAEFAPDAAGLVSEFGNVRIYNDESPVYQYMGFNLQDPKFTLKTRQAMAHAIDRQGIVDNALLGYGVVVETPIVPFHWASHPNLPGYPYNPTKAKQLLEEDGWVMGSDGILVRDGIQFVVELLYPTGNQVRIQSAPIIQQNFAEVGIKANLNMTDWGTLLDKTERRSVPYNADQFDLVLVGLSGGVVPDQSQKYHSRSIPEGNFVGYSNTDFDRMLDEALNEPNRDKMVQLYWEIQEVMSHDLPVVTLYSPNRLTGVSTRIKNVRPEGMVNDWRVFGLVNIHEWWIGN